MTNFPIINFGTLTDQVGAQQLCITVNLGDQATETEMNEVAEKLGKKALECLFAKENNAYAQTLSLDRGIVVFTKQHDPDDADHSAGMHAGVTVKEALTKVKETLREHYGPFQVDSEALSKLETFLEAYSAIGLEGLKAVMPEFEGIEDVLDELKAPEEKPIESSSSSWPLYLIAIVGISYIFYRVLSKKEDYSTSMISRKA